MARELYAVLWAFVKPKNELNLLAALKTGALGPPKIVGERLAKMKTVGKGLD